MICDAVDLLVQIGIQHEVKQITSIYEISNELRDGDASFRSIFRYEEKST
jgi:hypothetical protein